MKTKLTIISVICLVFAISSAAFAYDLTGMWDVTYRYRGAPMTVQSLIVQEGDTFTFDKFMKGTVNEGMYEVPGPLPGGRMDIKRAWLSRDAMKFKPSDDDNFAGFLIYSLWASEKSDKPMRAGASIKMEGHRIKDPGPRIMPLGPITIFHKTGEPFKDPGVFGHDPMGKDLTDKVVREGAVDVSKPGTYKITYNLTGDDGKKAKELVYSVTVVDPKPPTIKLLGDATITVTKGTLYSDEGVQARNFLHQDVSDKVKTTINGKKGDPNNPAMVVTMAPDVTYTINYLIEDEYGKAEVTRTVSVIGAEDEKTFWSYCFISSLLN